MTEGWILAARQDEVHNPRGEHEDHRQSHPLAGRSHLELRPPLPGTDTLLRTTIHCDLSTPSSYKLHIHQVQNFQEDKDRASQVLGKSVHHNSETIVLL